MLFVRRWRIEIWLIAVVLLVVLGFDGLVKWRAATDPVPVTAAWKLRADVLPGQSFDASMVDRIDVKADQPVLASLPAGDIFVHELHAGDVIRPDDVAVASTVTTVPLDFKIAPDLAPGEYIDVYGIVPPADASAPASAADSSALKLLGRHLAVVSVGAHVVVDVPTQIEAAWAYAIAGQQQLVAFISSAGGGACAQPGPLSLGQALQELNAAATAAGGSKAPSDCAGGS